MQYLIEKRMLKKHTMGCQLLRLSSTVAEGLAAAGSPCER
jgi:hypothetical protein